MAKAMARKVRILSKLYRGNAPSVRQQQWARRQARKAKRLGVEAWRLAWQLPTTIVTCTASGMCESLSAAQEKQEFVAKVDEIVKRKDRVVMKLQRLPHFESLSDGIYNRLYEFDSLHSQVMDLLATVADSVEICE
jgi:hypothetical protein